MKQTKSTTFSTGSEKPSYTSIMMLDTATQLRMACEEQAEAARAVRAEKSAEQTVDGMTKETVAVVAAMTVFSAVFWLIINSIHG